MLKGHEYHGHDKERKREKSLKIFVSIFMPKSRQRTTRSRRKVRKENKETKKINFFFKNNFEIN